jgi:hypothetical protein
MQFFSAFFLKSTGTEFKDEVKGAFSAKMPLVLPLAAICALLTLS